ncbi:scavenger receptor cysteine-rich domain-containing protein DMBT1-like [Amphiura filiformis]|uniref:scavenger receptor cysteine-rich domain-containing protein DMBT1-like n=1 Tax=Amphiura filiformis TaxID=82378 RepID=UPI003B20FDAA
MIVKRVRLVGGRISSEGRVEVFYNGSRGTVCDDSWDNNAAMVVCRQLGFTSGDGEAVRNVQFGMGTEEIWLGDVSCSGIEKGLDECHHNGWGINNCDHSEDAGVIYATYVLRLVGGKNSGEGRVFYNSSWGTVCDDFWDNNDAIVVCRQLGFPPGNAFGNAQFGVVIGEIWLDDVRCLGFENGLDECHHNTWGKTTVTTVRMPASFATLYVLSVAEIQVQVEWKYFTMIRDESWGNDDAMVVCRQLGFPCSVAQSVGNANFGAGVGEIWLDDVSCSGLDNYLDEYRHNGWGVNNCDHSEDAGVICSPNALVLPRLSYWDIVWGICNFTLQKRIERLQNRAGRAILKVPVRTPSSFIRDWLGWKRPSDRRHDNLCITVLKCLAGLVP